MGERRRRDILHWTQQCTCPRRFGRPQLLLSCYAAVPAARSAPPRWYESHNYRIDRSMKRKKKKKKKARSKKKGATDGILIPHLSPFPACYSSPPPAGHPVPSLDGFNLSLPAAEPITRAQHCHSLLRLAPWGFFFFFSLSFFPF